MSNDDRCQHCLAHIGIHRVDDFACPAAGKEAAIGAKQLWLSTRFTPIEDSVTRRSNTRTKTLEDRVARLEDTVKKQGAELRVTANLRKRMSSLEEWQARLAERLVMKAKKGRKL